jgi:hypothetical protein
VEGVESQREGGRGGERERGREGEREREGQDLLEMRGVTQTKDGRRPARGPITIADASNASHLLLFRMRQGTTEMPPQDVTATLRHNLLTCMQVPTKLDAHISTDL